MGRDFYENRSSIKHILERSGNGNFRQTERGLFFWDDTEGDTGLSACFTTDNNDPDDLLNEFDGGESTVDFDFVFSKIVPEYEEYEEAEQIHFRLRNDLLDLIFEKAVAYSLTQTDFLKIKKMDPLYIYRAYAHDDNPPGLMSKVGKNKPKVLDAKGFIKRRILKDHPYFSQIFDTEEWAEQYQDEFMEISQSNLAETLDLFLFTYLKENSKPEYIRAIAEDGNFQSFGARTCGIFCEFGTIGTCTAAFANSQKRRTSALTFLMGERIFFFTRRKSRIQKFLAVGSIAGKLKYDCVMIPYFIS